MTCSILSAMWGLVSPNGDVYTLTHGRVHTVNRKVGDIVLPADGSVSRRHASLEVKSPATDGVYVWDESSKFGTFVNEGIDSTTKLQSGVKATLKDGDRVRFGLQNNIFIVKKMVPRVCILNVKAAEKRKLASLLSMFGGEVEEKWSAHTTHLTCKSLCLTPEVMCALASEKPIVSPLFWEYYAQMIAGKAEPPNISKFIPVIEDKIMLHYKANACLPNSGRKTLFRDKLFIFPTSSTYQGMKHIVEMAGGRCGKLSDGGMSLEDYCKPDVIVLGCPENEQTLLYKKVLGKLTEKNRRVIPMDDIGLALWKVSINIHCNPTYSASSILHKPCESSLDQSTGKTYVMDSEDIDAASTGIELTNQVIPPSFSENLFTSEDKTMSLSMSLAQCQPPSAVPGPSRKRLMDGDEPKPKANDLSSVAVERDTGSAGEEDLFADTPRPSKRNVPTCSGATPSTRGKESNHVVDADNDFFLPSPPKKRVKKSIKETESMFDLPEEPVSKQVATSGDELDFLDSSRLSHHSSRGPTRSRNNACTLNESRDLFESTQDADRNTVTPQRTEKRKESSDSDCEKPPTKRPHVAHSNTPSLPGASTHESVTSGFIKIDSVKAPKKEPKEDEWKDSDLSTSFRAMVVVTSLLRKPLRDVTLASAEFRGKNFKKFRKVWNSACEKHCIASSPDLTMSGRRLCRNGTNGHYSDDDEEQAEDDPLQRATPAPRRGPRRAQDSEDEFALPSFSQV